MKKITLTLIAVSALGLAACTKTTPANNVVANDVNAVTEAMNDMNAVVADANSAANSAASSANSAMDSAAAANSAASSASNSASNSAAK